jgi:hypothetical protein
MAVQPPEPSQFVIVLGSGLGIAVGKVEARDQHAADGGFEVTRLVVLCIAGKFSAGHQRQAAPRKDGHAIPRSLPLPDSLIPGRS